MITYKIELKHTHKFDEYRTLWSTVLSQGDTLKDAKARAHKLLARFLDPIVLFEYEVR